MYKIGLSTTGKKIEPKLFEEAKNAGIDCFEVSIRYDGYDNLDYQGLRKMADDYGIKLWSFHLPFKPFDFIDISTTDKEWRKKSVAYIAEVLKKGADIGFDKFILHSGGLTKRQTQKEVDDRLNCACESYVEMAEIAQKEGGVICVENLPPVCVGKDIEEVKKLVSADSRLKVCFDTNHLLPGDGAEFIKAFSDRLITIHVSDYDFINERHWIPGEGKLDFQKILLALKEIGYQGPWLYEVGFDAEADGMVRERDINCFDISKNAKEIFENKPLTKIPGKIVL